MIWGWRGTAGKEKPPPARSIGGGFRSIPDTALEGLDWGCELLGPRAIYLIFILAGSLLLFFLGAIPCECECELTWRSISIT